LRINWRKRRNLLESLVLAVLFPGYLIAKVIPKNQRLCVFGSAEGKAFTDNSKYLFLYASRQSTTVRCVFISRNREVVAYLRSKGLYAEYIFSRTGVLTVVRASKAFVTHTTDDIHRLLLGGAEVVQLWHGTPLKKIGYQTKTEGLPRWMRFKIRILKVLYRLFPYLDGTRSFDRFCVSSDQVRESFQEAFRIPDSTMVTVGQPRNDCLSPDFPLEPGLFPEVALLEQLKRDDAKLVAWLPTYRRRVGDDIVRLLHEYGFDDSRLAQLLSERNLRLVIKPHPLEREALTGWLGDRKNIVLYDYPDPYPLLRYTDVLVTDYSSVFFDFLLLDRPVIFAPFDHEAYQKYSGTFYYEYDEITPGAKCSDWAALTDEIERVVGDDGAGPDDGFAAARGDVRDRFNCYKSGFSKRVMDTFVPQTASDSVSDRADGR
jgi:CDP-glycerol glycerophosphotransferase (TagB/SpsB family)